MATKAETTRPLNVFYCYAHEDEELLQELDTHLATLKKADVIRTLSEREIYPGQNRPETLSSMLDSADIVLLLVSPDFLYSDDLDRQVKVALARAAKQKARVIPIILRPTIWQDSPFGQFRALPYNGKPVTSWKNRSEAFYEVARGIRNVAIDLQEMRASETDWVTQGDQLMVTRRYEEAVAAFDQALARQPGDSEAYVKKGDALLALRDFRGALATYEQALRLQPDKAIAYLGRGRALFELGSLYEALRSCQQALNLDPVNERIYLELGRIYSVQQHYIEALNAYQMAWKLDPQNLATALLLGDTLDALSRPQEALKAYDTVLELSSEASDTEIRVKTELQRGHLLQTLQRYEQALSAYTHAARLDSKDVAAHIGRGETLLSMQYYEEALDAFDKALIFEPTNALAIEKKATVLSLLGQTEEATRVTAQSLTIGNNPSQFSVVFDNTGVVQASQARVELVQQFLKEAGFEYTSSQKSGLIARAKTTSMREFFPKGLYIRVVLDNELDQSTVQAIHQTARSLGVDHALVIINRHPAFSGSAEMSILRWEQGWRRFVVLTIDEAFVLESRAVRKEASNFLSYLRKNLGSSFNPYDVVDPITDVSGFFGRQLFTEALSESLRRGQRLGLFGIHKMGKSTILRQLQRRIEFPVSYVYLETNDSLDRIYRQILEEWELNGRVKYPLDFRWTAPQFPAGTITPSVFRSATTSLLNYLHTLTASPMLGIFLDEIEHIVPDEHDEKNLQLYIDLMDSLRGLQLESQCLSLLVAGLHPGVARYNYFWGQRKNPMHQIITEHFLPPLDQEDCSDMLLNLGQRVNLEYDQKALDYVLKMSGSHPFLARRLCSLANKKRKHEKSISLDIVTAAVQEFVSNPAWNSYFDKQGLWGELSQPKLWKSEVGAANHKILRRLAEASEDLPEEKLCEGLERSAAQEALYALKERSLITSPDNSGYYCITFGLLRNWIRCNLLGLALD